MRQFIFANDYLTSEFDSGTVVSDHLQKGHSIPFSISIPIHEQVHFKLEIGTKKYDRWRRHTLKDKQNNLELVPFFYFWSPPFFFFSFCLRFWTTTRTVIALFF